MSGVSLNPRIIPPSDPRHWHQITSLLTRSIIQQCAGHWTRRTGRDLPRHSRKLVSLNISRKHKNCCLDIIKSLILLVWTFVLITSYLQVPSVITALTGRRHSGKRKSQSDGWGQGSEITPARCTVDTEEMWALWQPPEHWVYCAAWPAAGHCQDWLLLPWAVSRHTAPTPTPQPNLEFQVLARKGIVSHFIFLLTYLYRGFLLIPDHPSRWSLIYFKFIIKTPTRKL